MNIVYENKKEEDELITKFKQYEKGNNNNKFKKRIVEDLHRLFKKHKKKYL